MKKLIFLMLSLASFSLEASYFQSSMSVTPFRDTNEYLIEMQIEKIVDENSTPQLVAAPKIICIQGQPAQLTIESEDKADLLSIQVIIPLVEDLSKSVQVSVLMIEKNQVVLSFENSIKLNN